MRVSRRRRERSTSTRSGASAFARVELAAYVELAVSSSREVRRQHRRRADERLEFTPRVVRGFDERRVPPRESSKRVLVERRGILARESLAKSAEVGDDSAVFGGDVGVDFTSVDEAVAVDVEERERERGRDVVVVVVVARLVETREFGDALAEAQLAVAVGVQAFQEALGVGVAADAEEEQEVAAVDGAARADPRAETSLGGPPAGGSRPSRGARAVPRGCAWRRTRAPRVRRTARPPPRRRSRVRTETTKTSSREESGGGDGAGARGGGRDVTRRVSETIKSTTEDFRNET